VKRVLAGLWCGNIQANAPSGGRVEQEKLTIKGRTLDEINSRAAGRRLPKACQGRRPSACSGAEQAKQPKLVMRIDEEAVARITISCGRYLNGLING